jgi:hypothetical protein
MRKKNDLGISWRKRDKTFAEWDALRKLVKYAPGDWIDAMDSSGIWWVGKVFAVVNLGAPIIHVHYEGFSIFHDEFINAISNRVAPLGFFTSKKDTLSYSESPIMA